MRARHEENCVLESIISIESLSNVRRKDFFRANDNFRRSTPLLHWKISLRTLSALVVIYEPTYRAKRG